jgi:hypothetical protein
MSEDIVTKFTDYAIAVPEFFIDYIGEELGKRDLNGLTAGRIKSLYPSGEHPLVALTGNLLSGSKPNFSGLLPAISVIEADENEENTTVGHGKRENQILNQSFVDDFKNLYPDLTERSKEGLLTNEQLDLIAEHIRKQSSDPNNEPYDGEAFTEVQTFWQRENVFVSLWAHNLQERQVLGKLLRSIVYDMRIPLIGRGVIDASIRISKGLVNFNFGRILYGLEVELNFLNKFNNYTVLTQPVLDTDLPVVVIGRFKGVGESDDKLVEVVVYDETEEGG